MEVVSLISNERRECIYKTTSIKGEENKIVTVTIYDKKSILGFKLLVKTGEYFFVKDIKIAGVYKYVRYNELNMATIKRSLHGVTIKLDVSPQNKLKETIKKLIQYLP